MLPEKADKATARTMNFESILTELALLEWRRFELAEFLVSEELRTAKSVCIRTRRSAESLYCLRLVCANAVYYLRLRIAKLKCCVDGEKSIDCETYPFYICFF